MLLGILAGLIWAEGGHGRSTIVTVEVETSAYETDFRALWTEAAARAKIESSGASTGRFEVLYDREGRMQSLAMMVRTGDGHTVEIGRG